MNSLSTIRSASAKPFSTSPKPNSTRFATLDAFLGAGSTPMVNISSCNSGASGFSASSTSKTCGSTSYLMSIKPSAFSAISSLVAATAATVCPTYSAFSRAMIFRVISFKLTTISPLGTNSEGKSSKSAHVMTAFTPFNASALLVSIERIFACA